MDDAILEKQKTQKGIFVIKVNETADNYHGLFAFLDSSFSCLHLINPDNEE